MVESIAKRFRGVEYVHKNRRSRQESPCIPVYVYMHACMHVHDMHTYTFMPVGEKCRPARDSSPGSVFVRLHALSYVSVLFDYLPARVILSFYPYSILSLYPSIYRPIYSSIRPSVHLSFQLLRWSSVYLPRLAMSLPCSVTGF